ncbi:unnamed protein product [Adineta steineri]|uniref:LCCL domain-containing protein n=2 Tax=Adineta steineri TaxID=433720 RepID=A0A813SQW5_9BILA|nr:unnamed protein product [Adineta steineri]CAF0798551.1 unnamed protein product [Adineta steineri]CAF4043231.1 unnamed protein product [Adineta steineri]
MDEQHNLQDTSIDDNSPVNLTDYREKIDQTFSFLITGELQGSVFGTNIYTDDSNIAAAAIHAGILSVGETKSVEVKMLPGQSTYEGSTQNGVTSSSYGVWMESYMFMTNVSTSLTTVTNLLNYRHRVNEVISISVTGLIEGPVFGTNIYTDDSNVGTAAVHAGVLSIGETKLVEVKILPGQSSYKGSTQNGITSSSYGPWPGSYVFIENIISSVAESMDLTGFRDKVGHSLYFLVTGDIGVPVYGTDIYTDDSNINAAAIHAGVVRLGETKAVIVNILPGQLNYQGSTKNRITSSSYGQWPGSFRFIDHNTTSTVTITNLIDYCSKVNQILSVSVTGSLGGSIYGTKIYTDDSIINIAAVHAGIANVGETKIVDIKILPGETSYQGSTQNGVISSSYEAWPGSYTFTINTINCVMAPIDLINFREKTNQLLSFVVTGKNEGSIFGTDIYTDDSNLAVAAVHSGMVTLGETKGIIVQILPGKSSYHSTTQNDITSTSYGHWMGSYSILSSIPIFKMVLSNLVNYRDKINQILSFTVIGATGGSVWGTNIYSDDSNIASAAVHAGVVNDNEMKTIDVKILPGQASYDGSIRNGITSLSYGSWAGSFVFVDNTTADEMASENVTDDGNKMEEESSE